MPPDPGLLSAYGMLATPVTRESSRTVLLDTTAEGAIETIAVAFDELEAQARTEMLDEGVVLIEWADRAEAGLPRRHWEVGIAIVGEQRRRFTVRRP